jgi:hypothetical protein
MGWNCSVNLYLPASHLRAGLLAVAQVVEAGATLQCEVQWSDGTFDLLPFGRLDDSKPQRLTVGREPVALDVVLKVPVDEVTEEWWDEEPYLEDGCQYVGVGLIRLWLSAGPCYAEMRFYGPTGDVSTLLYESRAVHNRLLGVLHQASGLAGVIIPDDGAARLLADPTVELNIDWDWVNGGDGDPDPEKLATEVIRQSGGRRMA